MADPFEEFIDKTGGGGDGLPEVEPLAAPAPGQTPAPSGGGAVTVDALTTLLGIVFPVAGKIATKAIGSKI